MEKRKSILKGALVAGALIAVSGLTANAASLFSYSNLGSGEEIRASLLNTPSATAKTLDLKCGAKAKTDSTKKGKDGKCGEGKCGEKKPAAKKVKDGKCGEGKCGASKKKG